MRLDQGEEHAQLHPAPELRPANRCAEGQRLDAARAEFRAEWQAKINHRREQAADARDSVKACGEVIATILYGGPAIGGILGFLVGFALGSLDALIVSTFTLAAVSYLLALGAVELVRMYSWVIRRRAERLESEAEELERS